MAAILAKRLKVLVAMIIRWYFQEISSLYLLLRYSCHYVRMNIRFVVNYYLQRKDSYF
jgi:hypothetical protein